MYASSDVNIVMMMFFGLFLLRKISEIPKRDSNPQLSDRRSEAGCGFESVVGSALVKIARRTSS